MRPWSVNVPVPTLVSEPAPPITPANVVLALFAPTVTATAVEPAFVVFKVVLAIPAKPPNVNVVTPVASATTVDEAVLKFNVPVPAAVAEPKVVVPP